MRCSRSTPRAAMIHRCPIRSPTLAVDWLAAQDPLNRRGSSGVRAWIRSPPRRGWRCLPCPMRYRAPASAVCDRAVSTVSCAASFVRGLTLSSLIQTAWALIVGRFAERRDPCFGSPGRPVCLAGAEQIVGLFVNSLPLTVEIDTATPLVDLPCSLQVEQARRREHDHIPLAELQAGWLPGTALFDTLLVIQNYPARHQPAGLEFELIELPETMDDNYALVLAVLPGPPMQLLLS